MRPTERPESRRDRYIPEGARRRQGAFYTPSIWVDEALGYFDSRLGSGWLDDAILWDPAAGTGNLVATRSFPELLVSTLEETDVGPCGVASEHSSATCFAMDFLSGLGAEGIPRKVDHRLQQAASAGRRLVFLANPPYGTAGNVVKSAAKKTAIAKNPVNRAMIAAGLRMPSQQLYAQFLFRMDSIRSHYGFERVTVGLFSKPNFLTATSYAAFRDWWFGRMSFRGGFLFPADEFEGVSARWGVSFTLWDSVTDFRFESPKSDPGEETTASAGEASFSAVVDVLERRGPAGLASLGPKLLYSSVGRRAFEWARGPATRSSGDGIQLKSGLRVHESGTGRDFEGHLGWLNNDSNDVYHSGSTVWLQSAGKASSNNNAGWFLTEENFLRSAALFAARKAVRGSWVNDKDEFLRPSPEPEGTPEFRAWLIDGLVYAMVHPSNTCVGADRVSYKGELWSLRNHFFWGESPSQRAPHPQAYLELEEARSRGMLTAEAARVVELLRTLLEETRSHRSDYGVSHPELQVESWDAGFYQLKGLFADSQVALWRALRTARQELEVKVRVGVYSFGFLRAPLGLDEP